MRRENRKSGDGDLRERKPPQQFLGFSSFFQTQVRSFTLRESSLPTSIGVSGTGDGFRVRGSDDGFGVGLLNNGLDNLLLVLVQNFG